MGNVVLIVRFAPILQPEKFAQQAGNIGATASSELDDASKKAGKKAVVGMLTMLLSVITVVVACKYATRWNSPRQGC